MVDFSSLIGGHFFRLFDLVSLIGQQLAAALLENFLHFHRLLPQGWGPRGKC